ncbi:translation initiation factor IF-3 [Candidatus Berkelbacteria bacterium]|nr:translation initiation factor IF-3 [Candidatus Berkelbacteria bacterium]
MKQRSQKITKINKFVSKQAFNLLKINSDISSPEVYLIDEEGKALGEVSRDQALYLAQEKGLDLIEVDNRRTPPVVKILDYQKYLYQKEKESRKKKKEHQPAGRLKEIRLSLKIGPHDLETKVKRAKDFLAEKNKDKVSLRLVGRENRFTEEGLLILEKFQTLTGGKFEISPRRIGNTVWGIITS